MADTFAQSVLKVAMAQICQNLGWHAVQTSPMNILIDILHRYLSTLARTTHQYSEHDNRTIPNLSDLGLAFKELGISLPELEEYVNNVEPVPFVHPVPQFPVQRESQFHFPKEGCREVQHRPEWIHPHLPAAYPELEEDESVVSPSASPDHKLCVDGTLPSSELGLASPTGSPRPGIRRPLEITQDTNFSTPKRPRLQSDEEGRPLREVMSVTMSAAGVISPVREGILPNARTPSKGFEDSRPNTPVPLEVHEPVLSPCTPPELPEVKKEVSKKEGGGSSKLKKVQKFKEGKKLKLKKDNKENKKKSLKEGKIKKKDSISKSKGLEKSSKVKKEKGDKSPKKSASKGSKSPKAAKPKSFKPKLGKSSDKLKLPSSPQEDMAKLTAKPTKKHGAKSPKSPKGSKGKGKSPKAEKQVAGGQLASLLAKASGAATIKAERKDGESSKLGSFLDRDLPSIKSELPDTPSVCDSPERLIIDDNPEFEFHERDSRMGKLDDCISAVIQRGLHDDEHHNTNSNSSEGLSSIPARVKLEPRDVYDFTDDEDLPDAGKSVDESTSQAINIGSPVHKRRDDEVEKFKDIKKAKRKDGDKKGKKQKVKSPRYTKMENENMCEGMWPKTPEPTEDSNDASSLKSPFSIPPSYGMPTMLSPTALSSLSHIPPALLPFTMQAFAPGGPSSIRSGGLSPGTSSGTHVPYPKLVDLADVAISKARHEGDFDVGRPKEKERGEKDKGKRKEKREKKEKDKLKLKRKKDKVKDKVAVKGILEKDREKVKSKKDKTISGKAKEKKEKPEKSRDKEKKKEKTKDKFKEKKMDKKKKDKTVKKDKPEKLHIPKEELERDCESPSMNSAIPRLTFKLGSGMASDGTKIVIKGLSNADSPSSSPLPPAKEQTPPISPVMPSAPHRLPPVVQAPAPSSSVKSHPKPISKVPPVPPAPARTVITETVGTIIDESGNKIWICPACTHPDDGSPMIGCDDCDEWYHWVCVGIVVPPKEDENWFCTRCIAKKQGTQKKRKHRKEK